MSENAAPKRSFKRALIRRCAKLLAGGIVLLIVVALAGYWFLLSPSRVASMARNVLSEMTGAEAAIGSATLDTSGKIELNDVVLRVPDMAGDGAELFRADRITMLCDRSSLWKGRVDLLDIVIDKPRVTVAEDPATGLLNLQMISAEPREDKPLRALPRVEIIDGAIRVGRISGERFLRAGRITVDGMLQVDDERNELYHLSLVETESGHAKRGGLVILGSVDITTRVAQAEVKGVSFADHYRTLLPSTARRVWDEIEPVGNIDLLKFAYEPETSWRALIELSDIELTLPKSTDADYRFRLVEGSGALRFDRNGIRIVKDLVGKVSGLEYAIAGSWNGYSSDAAFQLGFRSEPFALPNEPRVILALPEGVQKAFRMFAPEGDVRVSMAAWRREVGGEIDYEGTATFTGGKGRYERFPYELQNLRGQIRFTPAEVRLLSITGQTSGGGSATLTGVIAPPGQYPAVDLTIAAINVPFDNKLYEAMDEKQRPALDMFFHGQSYETLLEAGHYQLTETYNVGELALARARRALRSLPEDAPDTQRQELTDRIAELNAALETPPFELGGRGNMIVHITRGEGPTSRSQAVTEVDLQEANVVFKYFPYPMKITKGKLKIEPGKVTISDMEATGLHGGRVGLHGVVKLPRGERKVVEPDLRVYAMDVPIDDLLYDALPKPQDKWVRNLHPTGRIDVFGRIFAAQNDRPDIALIIGVRNGTLTPGGGRFTLEDVQSKIELTLDGLKIESLTGTHDQGTLDVTGNLDWSDEAGVAVALQVATRKLNFEEPIFDALEPFMDVDSTWRTFLKESQLTGVFDSDTTYRRAPDGKVDRKVELRPIEFSFVRDERRVSVTDVSGQLRLQTEGLTITHLAGTVGGAKVGVDGQVRFKPDLVTEAKMTLAGPKITDELKAALPAAVVETIDAMSIDGKFDATFDRFVYRPKATGDQPKIDLHGKVAVTEGLANIGVDVAELDGTVDVSFIQRPDQPHAASKLLLDAKSMKVMGREITALHAELVSSEKSGNLALPKIRGRTYDGAVGGYGAVSPGDKTFRFRLQLSDVDLHRFVTKDAKPEVGKEDQPPALAGTLSAALDVEGRWGEDKKMRARGDVQIRDGVMYRLPLALGLLQIAHLSLPINDSFSRATISYHMINDEVEFERIVLESPNVRMAGDGEMNAASKKLNLTLTTSNPSGIDLGPLTEIVDTVRDQFITVRVTGTLDEPKTEVKQLSGLTKAWRDVFGTPREQRD